MLSHEQPGRNRQHEITQIKSGLHDAGLKSVDLERFHKLLDEDVIEVVGNGPKEKQNSH